MDINTASSKELKKFAAMVEVEITKRQQAGRADLVKKMQAMAEAAGFTLDQLVEKPAPVVVAEKAKPGRKPGKPAKVVAEKRGPVAQKYRNPANEAETWSGRGRKPKWVEEFLTNGGSLESLLITQFDATPTGETPAEEAQVDPAPEVGEAVTPEAMGDSEL